MAWHVAWHVQGHGARLRERSAVRSSAEEEHEGDGDAEAQEERRQDLQPPATVSLRPDNRTQPPHRLERAEPEAAVSGKALSLTRSRCSLSL